MRPAIQAYYAHKDEILKPYCKLLLFPTKHLATQRFEVTRKPF